MADLVFAFFEALAVGRVELARWEVLLLGVVGRDSLGVLFDEETRSVAVVG